MPAFAIEVATLMAPTEIYEQLGPDTPSGWDKETQVFVVVATHKNTINWLVLGEMNKDSQKFRDEIYVCASKAHNTLDRGCGKYYRGTNSVHVKRLHSDAFESMYNHNHYPLGGKKGADFDASTFPEDVTPEEFKQHIVAFSEADAEMHGGTPRFLTKVNAYRIAEQFRINYEEQKSQEKVINPLREYTQEDIEELKLHQHEEQPCKAPEGAPSNTRGIGSERADERQPPEYSKKEYEYVVQFREEGKKRIADIESTVREVKDRLALQQQLTQVTAQATPGSPVAIAANVFNQDIVQEIQLHASKDIAVTQNVDPDRAIGVYNTTIVELLKDTLKDLDSKKAKTKATLPGLGNILQDVVQVKKDILAGMIKSCEQQMSVAPNTMLDFQSILESYESTTQAHVPIELSHNLKQMISRVDIPAQKIQPKVDVK